MSLYLRTEGLSVGYGGKPLIKDLNVGFGEGEIVTLIGPNGAGKSTILKTLTRHLSAVAGTVLISGTDVEQIRFRELARKMAVVLTDRAKPELMTCRDVVAMGRYPYTGSLGKLTEEDQTIVNDAMEMVNVLDLADRDFQTLSDGQRQRVLLARAICQQPEIIVLDEPTSFLDIRYKVELFAILKRMAREKHTTVVMSLHEIDLAQKVSDKILCVKGDTVEHFGTPDEVCGGGLIPRLYEVGPETYNPLMGSIEMEKPEGEPEAFVISACGSGIPVYRQLQKQGVPFAAGILHENDVDCQVAAALASRVVTEKPFHEISEQTLREALDVMAGCGRILLCSVPLGPGNARMSELIAAAEASGKCERR